MHTYTYSLLEVPKPTFDDIRRRLADGGVTFKDGEPLDMHGVALVPEESPSPEMYIQRDDQGFWLMAKHEGEFLALRLTPLRSFESVLEALVTQDVRRKP